MNTLFKILSSSTRGVQLLLLFNIICSIIALSLYDIDQNAVLLIILGYFLYGCLGVVITFHRRLTHNSYNTYPLLTNLFSMLGCLGGTGSPLAWVAIHINHHLKSDRPNDPHSPVYKGLKIFNLNYSHDVDKGTKWKMRGILTNKFQQILHRYYFALIFSWIFCLWVVGGVYLVLFLHTIPATITAIMSNIVNYVGHTPAMWGGYRRYNLNDQSVNNWLWAIPSWGETWHNNHHRHPRNYSCGQRWWEIDISGLIIRLIKTS